MLQSLEHKIERHGPPLLQQAQLPHQICNDDGKKCSDDYDGYGNAEPTHQSDYPTRSKFGHGEAEPSSFDRHAAVTLSLGLDEIPSAQKSLQTNSFPTRQALTPSAVNTSGSPQ
jgi:hypothetical protein